jgi:creatinine amidohydrolase
MKISEMHWAEVEAYLAHDDRAVLPIGCTEQHAFLSLSVDSILAERVALEAAEPLGVPVFPVIPYGITPSFMAYPGTVSLRIETFLRVVEDTLDSLARHGFKRILIVNGHGGNAPAQAYVSEWMGTHPGVQVRFHNWWNAPKTWATVQAIDPVASHASWMENFPTTRLPHVRQPTAQKPMVDFDKLRLLDAEGAREYLGDGNFGGLYQRVAVEETRALIARRWR